MPRNSVLCIIGRKGQGKSYLAGQVIQERERVFIIDSLAEYGEERGCEVAWEEDCVDAVLRVQAEPRFKLSLRCLALDDNLDLIRLCDAVNQEHPGVTLVIEETSLYVSPTTLPDEIASLVRYGRHYDLDLIFIARRPAELHRDLTANADLLVTFQTQEPRDLVYLRSFYGAAVDELPNLPPYHLRVFGEVEGAPSVVLERLAHQDQGCELRPLEQAELPLDEEPVEE